LLPHYVDKFIFIFSVEGDRRQLTFEAPMKSKLLSERRLQYYAEMALAELAKEK
jgi:hypothetical protein